MYYFTFQLNFISFSQYLLSYNLTGVFTGLKWGAKFNLWHYTSNISPSAMRLISMAYTTKTWSSYQTAWFSFRAFCIFTDTIAILPLSVDTLINYINFLATWRKLQANTIRGYVSALKILHYLNRHSVTDVDHIFSDHLVTLALRGVEHICLLNPKPANPRRVMTFSCLELLGHGLTKQGLNDYDLLSIWTACTLGFWGSFRMSEILPSGEKPNQTCNALTWSKIFKPKSNQLTISIKFPKSMKHGSSDAVNIFRYMDKNYCPVTQLCSLYNSTRNIREFNAEDLVFRLQSGSLLTMTILNKILRNVMSEFFDGNHSFSCHSFRAGVPALMASQPHLFKEEEIKVTGRWSSDAYLSYTRLSGISREIALSKFHDFLSR